MSQGGRRILGPCSTLVIALAIAGAGLDALPATLLLDAPTCEMDREVDLDEIKDDEVCVPSSPIRLRRERAPLAWDASPPHLLVPLVPWRATTHLAAAGTPPRRSIWLCCFLC
jgi:hypothetical protein